MYALAYLSLSLRIEYVLYYRVSTLAIVEGSVKRERIPQE